MAHTLFKLLPALPAADPAAVPFSASGQEAQGDGLAVHFSPEGGESWAGNFQRGGGDHDSAHLHPRGRDVVVIAGGQVYIVDPQARRLSHVLLSKALPADIAWSRALPDLGLLLLAGSTMVFALQAQGPGWSSRRLSWGGLRNLEISGARLTGEGRSHDGSRHSFSLDLRTGEAEGGAVVEDRD
jgi:hypothetical protein